MKIRVKEDSTGTLWHYPSRREVPSAGTVTLYQSGGTSIQASTAATVDSVDTTIGADASRGARSLTVADSTGIAAGVRYLLTDSGQVADIEVKSVSGTTIYLVTPLTFAASSGATFKGYRLTYSLTATHTQDRGDNFRATWTYTVGAATYAEDSLFDVVSAVEYYPTTLADVAARHPRIPDLLYDGDLDGFELLRTAWVQRVVPQMDAKGLRIERIRDLANLVPYHVAIVNELVAENEAMTDADRIEQYELAKRNSEAMLSLYSADVDWYDDDDDLAEGEGEAHRSTSYFEVLS